MLEWSGVLVNGVGAGVCAQRSNFYNDSSRLAEQRQPFGGVCYTNDFVG